MRLTTALLFAALLGTAAPAMAEKLGIDRIYDNPALSGPTVMGLKVAPDGSRVTFLRGSAQDQYRMDLWEYDRKDGALKLLVSAAALEPHGEHLDVAERARRERERTAMYSGILDYHWAPDGKAILFPLNGKLYLYRLAAPPGQAVQQLPIGAGFALDPKISPKGRYVSFIREQNLWVYDLQRGTLRELTNDDGTIHDGEAEFVAQEELDRHTGYWWAPDDSAIAFERYNDAPVPIAERFDIYADHTEVVKQRYPYAGDPNVIWQLGLISPEGGAPRFIDVPAQAEYLARVNWLPDAKALTYQWLARDQKRLDLVKVNAATLAQTTLLSETSKTWVDVNNDLRFLKDKPEFIWASQRSGWNMLYLYSDAGRLLHPISTGAWHIDNVLGVDEKKGLVYVSSNRDFVPDREIYALKLDGSTADAPIRISRRAGTHVASFAPDGSFYVDTFNSPEQPPQVSVHAAAGQRLAWIEENKLDAAHPYWPYLKDHIEPEFGTLQAADGQTLYYRVYKPLGFDPRKRYPVFDTFYGGPHVQSVTDTWPDLFNEYMAQHGFVVFTLDNRGMARRGRAFADAVYHQFGKVEVQDQTTGIDWLRQQPWVDPARIGVFGWSFGGYLTVMLLARDSAQLAGGVAVAPVTNWKLYDTAYTERYLGTPQQNPEGYQLSSVFPWIKNLPSHKLLLVHGMADDNVLFQNSVELMSALQNQGTQFRLMTYPGAKHGLSSPAQRKHVFHLIADFFQRQVAGDCGETCKASAAPAGHRK